MKAFAAIAVLLAAACGGSSPAPTVKTSVATVQQSGLKVELLAASRLEVGMTPIWIKITTTSGDLVRDAGVKVVPLMTMADKSHSAPVIESPEYMDGEYYGFAVVFSMPSGAMGTWSASVTVQRPTGDPVVAVFDNLTVADTGRARSFSYTEPGATMATKYLASLNFDEPPRVGLNPVTVTLHRMQDMMTFMPVTDAVISLDPQMPSMGHGSPGSVNPTHTTLGRYAGKLSFSMAGDWQTTLTIKKPTGETLGSMTIATTF